MFNLKKAILALTLTAGTAVVASEEFTPKLIIKNMTHETLAFDAPEGVIQQLKAQNSKQLHTLFYEIYPPIEKTWIQLNPNDTLVLDSVPEYLVNKYTHFLSPDAFHNYLWKHIIIGGPPVIGRTPFVTATDMEQAILLKKDIMIHIALDTFLDKDISFPSAADARIPYLKITKTELIDRQS